MQLASAGERSCCSTVIQMKLCSAYQVREGLGQVLHGDGGVVGDAQIGHHTDAVGLKVVADGLQGGELQGQAVVGAIAHLQHI